MKRALALGLAIVLGSSTFVTFHGAEPASASSSATPSTIALDCTSATSLADTSSVDPLGTNRLITGRVGYTFTITNSAANSSDTDCDVFFAPSVISSSRDAQPDRWPVTGSEGSFPTLALTIVGSGSFRVKTGAGDGEVTFNVDACDLTGSGIAADPWLVGSAADFQKVGFTDTVAGGSSCGLSGHYLQTADIELSDPASDIVGNGTSDKFSGVYDGDHYDLRLTGIGSGGWASGSQAGATYESVKSLFPLVDGGTIKRLRLSGEIRTDEAIVGGLVGTLTSGLISEVSSSVNVESSADDAELGGLVGRISTAAGDVARIQYSRVRNSLEHYRTDAGASVTTSFGGLVGEIKTATGQTVEIRDSYARTSVTAGLTNERIINAGGLVGSIESGNPLFVRTYSVFSNPAVTCTGTCDTTRNVGGLVGEYQATIAPTYVANFFVTSSGVSNAVGALNGNTQPVDYTESGVTNLPVAVPVSDSEIRRIATFTTKEAVVGGSASGNPGGDDLLASATDTSEDYLWAIEQTRVQTFVPSNYDVGTPDDDPGSETEQNLYTNRVVYPDTSAKSYPVRTAGDSAATEAALRPLDEFITTDYPELGRVWEICDGQDYPWLVWEEVDGCSGGGGGSGGTTTSSKDTSPSTADLAAAAGLSEAEYAAFLASGLTLEQFLASRLAATGPSSPAIVGGISAAGALVLLGGSLLIASRARRTTAHR